VEVSWEIVMRLLSFYSLNIHPVLAG